MAELIVFAKINWKPPPLLPPNLRLTSLKLHLPTVRGPWRTANEQGRVSIFFPEATAVLSAGWILVPWQKGRDRGYEGVVHCWMAMRVENRPLDPTKVSTRIICLHMA